jgi:hypothetical protein
LGANYEPNYQGILFFDTFCNLFIFGEENINRIGFYKMSKLGQQYKTLFHMAQPYFIKYQVLVKQDLKSHAHEYKINL